MKRSLLDYLPFRSSEEPCTHESVTYIEGNCIYRDADWYDLGITLFRYRPYYPRCDDCGETNYDQRYTADGDPTSQGECIDMIDVPSHVFDPDEYLREYDHPQQLQTIESESETT